MSERERLKEEQERAAAVYDEVKAELLQIPGVVDVGIGLKEIDRQPTQEISFRVYVEEKLPESELAPEEIVPETIRGFRTDVIKKYERELIIGFNDEDDWKNYSPKVGGSRIGNDQDGGGTGTLGCFARRTSDNSVVILSNHHVLFSPNGGAPMGAKVGQPDHDESCCCACNEIAEVVAGDAANDCAIAKLKDGVDFAPKVRRIRRPDNSVELSGLINGSGVAIASDEVWKVGARTGLTRGTVTQTIPELVIQPNAPFLRVANRGDSGSVVVDLAGDVVGLLYAIDTATETLGFAKPINDVLTSMGITIIVSDPTADYQVAQYDDDDDGVEPAVRALEETAFAPLVERLRASEAGRHVVRLFQTHGRECLHLVNHHRPVTAAWYRSAGPSFMAALARSAKEPAYRIPDQLDGVTRAEAATRLVAAFELHGSPALRAEIHAHAHLVDEFLRCDTVDELVAAWESAVDPRQLAGRPG